MKKNVNAFEGIIEIIQELDKSYNMVVISSSPTTVVNKELEKFNLSKYFKEIIGRESTGVKRFEKIDAISRVVEKYSSPENTISIGDRNVDFIAGSKAGLKNIILVDYGWGYDLNKIPEYNQKMKVNSPKELLIAIKEYC